MSKARQRKAKKEGAAAADAAAPAPALPTPAAAAAAAAPTTAASSVSLKDQGNCAFIAADYPRALELFTAAIDCLQLAPDSGLAAATATAGVDTRSMHLLYSNRSATHLALRSFPEALEDADRVVALKADWAKGHYRRGSALEGLLQFQDAAVAYAKGLECDPTDLTLQRSAAELNALLQELKLTESQLAKAANPDADRFELMVKWMKEGGSKFPRLYLQYYSEGQAPHQHSRCADPRHTDSVLCLAHRGALAHLWLRGRVAAVSFSRSHYFVP